MAAKDDVKILKSLVVPFAIGTLVVVGIALLGRIMTERNS
jgi:hypothetical protein